MYLSLYFALAIFEIFLLFVAVGILNDIRSRNIALPAASAIDLLDQPAPQFAAIDVRSGRRIVSGAMPSADYALIFLSSGCRTCETLAQSVAIADHGSLIVFCTASRSRCTKYADIFSNDTLVLSDPDASIARKYAATRTPAAVVIVDGRVKRHGHPVDAATLLAMHHSCIIAEGGDRPAEGAKAQGTVTTVPLDV